MRESDAKSLLAFISRMGMYIFEEDKENIRSFLTGYEVGSLGECCFTEMLSNKLEEKYKIKKYATGWSDQVERYAGQSNIDWQQAFQLVASEVLGEITNQQNSESKT
ncbi:MAG: hypothetical protein ACRBCI_02125 [Cellvibrionaceae bacterium]